MRKTSNSPGSVILVERAGVPVQMTLSREEEMATTALRHPVTGRVTYTNNVPCGSCRCPAGPQMAFATEAHMENLTEALQTLSQSPRSLPLAGGTNVAGTLIRNLATVGGNLCDASPAADASPPPRLSPLPPPNGGGPGQPRPQTDRGDVERTG